MTQNNLNLPKIRETMPAYQIHYSRKDMPSRCTAIKFANTEKDALSMLCTGSEKKGFRLAKAGVIITDVTIKEIKI